MIIAPALHIFCNKNVGLYTNSHRKFIGFSYTYFLMATSKCEVYLNRFVAKEFYDWEAIIAECGLNLLGIVDMRNNEQSGAVNIGICCRALCIRAAIDLLYESQCIFRKAHLSVHIYVAYNSLKREIWCLTLAPYTNGLSLTRLFYSMLSVRVPYPWDAKF
jgi:hypothetical protein